MIRQPYARVALGVFLVLGPAASAQSHSDLSAYSALVVSPVGALTPVALDDGRAVPERMSVGLNYERWRFDINDAIHNNVGVTLSHRLGSSNTSLSATGAYLSASCDCSGWLSGGVSLRSILLSTAGPGDRPRSGVTGHVAVDVEAGGARFQGIGAASGYSAAANADIGGSVSIRGSSRIAISVTLGLGWGHLSSADESGDGFRPVYGAAVSWKLPRGVSVDFGARRIVLKGGPTGYGGGISWRKL
ncbi:MAG: hypothetical protein ABI442_17690 [Gemmatimonadaceae bacterium]